jgi:nicotinamidase-related amidase
MILLIVDAQTKIVTRELYDYERFVENVQRLIFTARENGVEVVYIRHDDGTELTKGVDGFEIFKAFAPQPNEKIFDKTVNSAFKSSGLNEYLRSKTKKLS